MKQYEELTECLFWDVGQRRGLLKILSPTTVVTRVEVLMFNKAVCLVDPLDPRRKISIPTDRPFDYSIVSRLVSSRLGLLAQIGLSYALFMAHFFSGGSFSKINLSDGSVFSKDGTMLLDVSDALFECIPFVCVENSLCQMQSLSIEY